MLYKDSRHLRDLLFGEDGGIMDCACLAGAFEMGEPNLCSLPLRTVAKATCHYFGVFKDRVIADFNKVTACLTPGGGDLEFKRTSASWSALSS